VRHPAPFFVHLPEVLLGRGIALLGRAPEPVGGLAVVLFSAAAVVVHCAEVVLGKCDALPRRLAQPFERACVVAVHAFAFLVHQAKVELRVRISPLGRLPKPYVRLLIVFARNILAVHADPLAPGRGIRSNIWATRPGGLMK
jgi:hypothetical protein